MTEEASRLHLSPPDLREFEGKYVMDALASGWLAPVGPHADAFEQELARRVGAPHAAVLSSGTAALHLALLLLGVGPEDEVLLSTFTFAATANAVTYVGARPVLVDADRAAWQLDPSLLSEELAARARSGTLPKAVVTVDLYGQCADYDPIIATCAQYGIPIIEDAAEALGASYQGRPAGSFGAMGVLSFNGNKIITTSGGGALLSDRPEWIERARYLASQARQDAPHYEHTEVGYNYRLSNLLAALGRAQLATLEERVARKREINATYRRELADIAGVDFMPEADYGRSNCWLTCITIDPNQAGVDRETVRLHLEDHNIESRPVWKPMHLQPVFADCEVVGGAVSAHLFDVGLCLPSGSGMSDSDLDRVISGLREVLPGA